MPKHFKGCCCNCGIKFYLDTRSGKITTNFTAQRIDNELGHSIDNCEPFCYQCVNLASSHPVDFKRYSFENLHLAILADQSWALGSREKSSSAFEMWH